MSALGRFVGRNVARILGPTLARLTRCHCLRPGSHAHGWDHLTSGHHYIGTAPSTADFLRVGRLAETEGWVGCPNCGWHTDYPEHEGHHCPPRDDHRAPSLSDAAPEGGS